MSDGLVARLKVLLGIDSAEFVDGADEAEAGWAKLQGNIVKGAKLIGGALAAMGIAALADDVRRAADDSIKLAKDMTSAAKGIGITTDELQRYRFVAEEAGVAQDALEDGLRELNMKLGEAAEGSKSALAIFERMGVSIFDANGKLLDSASALPLVADALGAIEDPARRASAAAQLFGEDVGPKMAGLVAQGSAGIANLSREFDALGIAISGDTLTSLGEMGKELERMNQQITKEQAETIARNKDEIIAYERAVSKLKILLMSAVGELAEFGDAFDRVGFQAADSTHDLVGNFLRDLGTLSTAGYRWGIQMGENFARMATTALMWVRRMVGGIQDWLGGRLTAVFDGLRRKVQAAGDWFYDMYDRVVGHSYVPDMVDEIGQHMRRLDQEMVATAGRATQSTAEKFEALRQRLATSMDRLFPEVRRKLDFEDELLTWEQSFKDGKVTAEAYAEAIRRLKLEYYEPMAEDSLKRLEEAAPNGAMFAIEGKIHQAGVKYREGMDRMKTDARDAREDVVDSFSQMVDGSLRELDRFVSGIRSGNWLDIISGVLGAIESITGILSGGTGASSIKIGNSGGIKGAGKTPGFASGGMMQLGGLSGVDRNLLSLNGHPLARVSRGETMTITPANDRMNGGGIGGELVVRLEKDGSMSAYFEGIAGRVVERSAPGIAAAGAGLAIGRMQKQAAKALG